jgi:hypothetical protein
MYRPAAAMSKIDHAVFALSSDLIKIANRKIGA